MVSGLRTSAQEHSFIIGQGHIPLLRRLHEVCFAQLLICSGDAIRIDITSKLFRFSDKAILLKCMENEAIVLAFLFTGYR